MTTFDEAVKRYEEGDTWEDGDEVVEVEVSRPLDKVIPVRLASDKWEALRAEAKELGLGPTTLARMWLLEKLRDVQADQRLRAASHASTKAPRKRPPASNSSGMAKAGTR
ncbi:MAG: hypothetical protein HYX51_06150 [Chloroflexi bacterium]|nr:hypothetical protein [Chloroflexota bacterium]